MKIFARQVLSSTSDIAASKEVGEAYEVSIRKMAAIESCQMVETCTVSPKNTSVKTLPE